jgi:hypothetical protein
VITTGTVGGVSVVGEVVFSFTIEDSAIGLNATARTALEDQFDGTGLTGDTYPSTQAQVGNIGSASGGGLSFEASTDNVLGAIKTVTFVGVQTSGTYANTEADDSVYHNITHSGNAIDIVYQFDIGGNYTAAEFIFNGYMSSANDTLNIQAYDFVGADWETRFVLSGQGGTTDITESIKLLSKHTGTGADIGTVLIRFVTSAQTAPDLFIDSLIVSAATSVQSTGYANGAVWINTVNGVAGTESYVNGVADNPVDSIADASTIRAALNLTRYELSSDSSITFTTTHAEHTFSSQTVKWDLVH